MIQITERYAINVLSDCYGVGVNSGKKTNEKKYPSRWFYADLESAMKKISMLLENEELSIVSSLNDAIKAIVKARERMDKAIHAALK